MSENTSIMRHTTLVAAISAIMGECQYLQKEKAAEQKIRYRILTEGQVVEMVRPLLVKHGVIVAPVAAQKLEEIQYEQNGNTWYRQEFLFTFRVMHRDSTDTQEIVAVGEACNNADKGANCCATVALKYALRQMLYLETGDDPDYNAADNMQGKAKTASKATGAYAERTQGAMPASEELMAELLATLQQYNPEYTLANALPAMTRLAEKRGWATPTRDAMPAAELVKLTIAMYAKKIAEVAAMPPLPPPEADAAP